MMMRGEVLATEKEEMMIKMDKEKINKEDHHHHHHQIVIVQDHLDLHLQHLLCHRNLVTLKTQTITLYNNKKIKERCKSKINENK